MVRWWAWQAWQAWNSEAQVKTWGLDGGRWGERWGSWK